MAKNYNTTTIGRTEQPAQDPWAKPMAALKKGTSVHRTPAPLTIIGRIQSWIRRHT